MGNAASSKTSTSQYSLLTMMPCLCFRRREKDRQNGKESDEDHHGVSCDDEFESKYEDIQRVDENCYGTNTNQEAKNSCSRSMSSEELDLLGISVHNLREKFMAEVRAEGLDENAMIYDLEDLRKYDDFGIIRRKGANSTCPIDGKMGSAYVHTLKGADNVGPATIMLSYAWAYRIGDIIDTLQRHCDMHSLDIKRTYVWICCLCVNQHRVVEMKRKGDFVTFEDLAKTFRSRVTGIGHILAMMAPWFAPTYLERLWCVYEMYMAHLHDCQITIGMPSSERENFVDGFVVKDSSEEGLVTKFFETLSAINVKNAKASVDADRSNILQLIQDGPGYEAFNVIVNQLIRNWAVNLVNDEVKVRTATLEKDSVYNGKDYLNVDKVGGEDEIIGVLDAMVFFQRVGLLYERMGELDKALALYEQVKEMIEKKLGPDHEIMVDPLLNIGKICRMQGKYEEALEYFNQMLVICERDYGPDHLTTGQAYTCTAQVYGDQGLHDKALQLYQRSLVIEERESGKNAISTAEILEHVAVELMNLGQDYEDALQKFHEVLSIKVDHYGKGTIYAALTMKNIASTLAASNRYEEAINTCQEALTIYEKVYGPDHPDTVALAALPGLIVTLKGL